jgi:FkbM family methyltransferase
VASVADSPSNPHAFQARKEGPYQAQHGEDRWLEAFFGRKTDGFFVEVGAYDGVVLSNTFFFENVGWRGVLVEPDPAKAAQCRANRPGSQVFECAAVASREVKEISFFAVQGGEVYSTASLTDQHRQRVAEYGLPMKETRVRAMTLDEILEKAGARAVDFITIDVEEGELEVLKGFDIARWRPAAVMVETNSRFRKPEIRRYFVEHGYVFRYSIVMNDIYVPFRHDRRLAAAIDGASYVLHRLAKSLRFRWNAFLEKRRRSPP